MSYKSSFLKANLVLCKSSTCAFNKWVAVRQNKATLCKRMKKNETWLCVNSWIKLICVGTHWNNPTTLADLLTNRMNAWLNNIHKWLDKMTNLQATEWYLIYVALCFNLLRFVIRLSFAVWITPAGTMCCTSPKELNIQEISAGLWQAVCSWPGSSSTPL